MTMIGHNQPSAFEESTDRASALIANGNRWLDEVTEITTEDKAAKCKDFIDQIRLCQKTLEDLRKAEKQPFMDAAKGVDGKYKPFTSLLEAAGKMMKAKMTDWLKKQEAIRIAAARKAEEEALAKMLQAEQAAKDAAKTVEAAVAAEELKKAADEAVKEADKIANSRAQNRGQFGRKAMSLRTRKVGVITDQDLFYQAVKADDAIRDALQTIANAAARKGEKLPGMEIKEEQGAA